MDAQVFWEVIGNYNETTKDAQIILLCMLVIMIGLSYINKVNWAAKVALGIANLFIAIGFFLTYGTQPIQKFFALPLYLGVGILFLYESWKNKEDALNKPDKLQIFLLLLYILYPVVSVLCGNHFPNMVTHIMPCPIVSLSLIVYAGYKKKNKVLLLFLTIWGLTGVKSVIFQAYEDLILLLCGIYGVVLLINEIKAKEKGLNDVSDCQE